jgi:hypothetical protein
LHPRNEYEQHMLLSSIERMHREGRSEHEIVAELHDMGARPVKHRSRSTRPVRGRLARWASRARA